MSGFNMPPGVSPSDIQGFDADDWRDEGNQSAHTALTLRDVFAAEAMNGLLASYAGDRNAEFKHGVVAAWSYRLADAMLRERMKP